MCWPHRLTCYLGPLLSHGCSDDIGAVDFVSVPFCFGFIKPLATHILQLLVILNFFRQMSTEGEELYFVENPQ